jgi:ADP-ribosylglycohydrolase
MLTSAQADRAAGVLLATACGDALGAPYEFGPSLAAEERVEMMGGGAFGWKPGEWTDDTSMAMPIARACAAGADLRDEQVLDGIVQAWSEWARTAPDVGIQTRSVLAGMAHPSASEARAAARRHHESTGRSAGNGSLMRTAPVALAYLDDPDGLAEAARALSGLTHHDPEAGDACALWCMAIRHAVLEGTLEGVGEGLAHLPVARRDVWVERLEQAEARPPSSFTRNGWVVEALQGAWSAIVGTQVPADQPGRHLQRALKAAVRGGRDTDTVAAIAGGLLGGRWGASAIPAQWRRIVHGWPVEDGAPTRARELVALATAAARGGPGTVPSWPDVERMPYLGWPDKDALAPHPHDSGVWLAGVDAVDSPPRGVDAVVALCRVGSAQVPPGVRPEDRVEVWLLDEPDPACNPNLDLVLSDAADVVASLRQQGRTVLLHCVAAHSRTPTVGALYAHRHLGIPMAQAIEAVCAALPAANPNEGFRAALDRLATH